MSNPAKPTALRVLEGNRGKRPLPKNEPKPRPITPDPPPYLSPLARRRWDELLPELEIIGTLTIVDGDVLACYAMAYADVVELTADIEAEGRSYSFGLNGAQAPRPEVGMLNRAKDDLRRFGAELGVGAASRTKVEVKKPDAGQTPLEAVRQATRRR